MQRVELGGGTEAAATTEWSEEADTRPAIFSRKELLSAGESLARAGNRTARQVSSGAVAVTAIQPSRPAGNGRAGRVCGVRGTGGELVPLPPVRAPAGQRGDRPPRLLLAAPPRPPRPGSSPLTHLPLKHTK